MISNKKTSNLSILVKKSYLYWKKSGKASVDIAHISLSFNKLLWKFNIMIFESFLNDLFARSTFRDNRFLSEDIMSRGIIEADCNTFLITFSTLYRLNLTTIENDRNSSSVHPYKPVYQLTECDSHQHWKYQLCLGLHQKPRLNTK